MKHTLLAIFLVWFTIAKSQTPGTNQKTDLSFKPRPGFNYHMQISHVDIAPILAFKPAKNIQAGFGLNYIYNFKKGTYQGKSSFGFNLFSRYFINTNFFFHGEYLLSSTPYLNELNYKFNRVRKADLFLGGGYKQPITDKTDAYFYMLVNINNSFVSPYKNIILFKVGITF